MEMKKVEIPTGNGDQTVKVQLKGLEPGYDELLLWSCETLGTLTRPIDYDAETIHTAFGNKTSYTGYIVIKGIQNADDPTDPETYQATVQILDKSSFQELTEIVSLFLKKKGADPRTVTVYYYLPVTKYIFVIREEEILVIDYANYDHAYPGDTALCRLRGMETPLAIEKYVYDSQKLASLLTEQCEPLFSSLRAQRLKDKYSCSHCHKHSKEGLQMCSRCRAAYYCNGVCQNAHWSVHKEACQKVLKVRDGKVVTLKKPH